MLLRLLARILKLGGRSWDECEDEEVGVLVEGVSAPVNENAILCELLKVVCCCCVVVVIVVDVVIFQNNYRARAHTQIATHLD